MYGSYAIAVGRGRHRHALGQCAASLDLPVRIETGELLLFAEEPASYLHEKDTILVGQAFSPSGDRLDRLPAGLADVCPGDLEAALRPFWGNYAIFSAGQDGAFVYREPSAAIPVYRCGGDHETVFVSDAAIASRLGLLRQSALDHVFLVHWLQFPFLRTRRTGFREVSELLPGMCLRRRGPGRWTEATLWHPSGFISGKRPINDPAEAARLLRDTALPVVAAQLTRSNAVLRLSGGLDSAIIAACLAHEKLCVSCINFATRARDGDERDYAREVARRFDLRLLEADEPPPQSLAPPSHPAFRPLLNPLLAPFEHAIAQAACDLGATLLIDGGGGDNLFCSIASAAPVIDALGAGRLGTAAATLGNVAVRFNCTAWDVLRAAGRSLPRRQPVWKEDRSFLAPGHAIDRCEVHPWLHDLTCPPGKRYHVEALVHVQHFLDRSPSAVPLLHPLLAQPLLELCLRIPSWLWFRGGRDRAIARDAFAGLVPKSILQRRSKGSLQSLLYRSFQEHRLDIRRLLLGGKLAELGILDSPAIEEALTGETWMTGIVQLRLSEMAALELWLRSLPLHPLPSAIAP